MYALYISTLMYLSR